MTQTMKRPMVFVLAAILAFALTFTAVPLTAHAAIERIAGNPTEFQSAIAACADGDKITLTANITYECSSSSPAIDIDGKSITIDVGSHVLDVNYTGSDSAVKVTNGTLALQKTTGAFNVTAVDNALTISGGGAAVSTLTATGLTRRCISGINSTVTVSGDVNGYVMVQDSTVSTGNIINGRLGLHGTTGSVTVNGNIQGGTGLYNQSTGGTITVNGDVIVSSSATVGVSADAGVTIVTGSVQAGYIGVVATGGIAMTGSVTATDADGIGVSASSGGQIVVTGDVQGGHYGARSGPGSEVTVSGNVTATQSIGMGASSYGGTITIGGTATGPQCGIDVRSNGTVSAASASGTGASGTGICTGSGQAYVAGEARGEAYGIQASGGTTTADSATATGSTSTGVFADAGTVSVNNAATGVRYGINTRGGTVTAGGATATGATGTGAAIEGGTATINGDVAGDTGVFSVGTARVNGHIQSSSVYILIGDISKTVSDGVPQSDADLGYLKYSDSTYPSASVFVLSPLITFSTQPAASTNVNEGSISGSLACDAGVAPSGTLTYLWYSCDDTSRTNPVSTGVTDKSFTIPTILTAGTYHYFCRATGAVEAYKDSDVSTVTVNSIDAALSGLTISDGTLSPAFAQNTYSYTASVPYSVSKIKVTPTVHEAHATVTVNGTSATSGTASGDISLNVGSNTIPVTVTAQDGSTTKTYTVAVNRAERTYTVVYDINGGTSGTTASSTHTYGVAKNLTTNGYTRTGWTFSGWAATPTGPKVYTDGQSVTSLADTDAASVRLYAVWVQNTCTISFDTGSGGPSVPPVSTGEGVAITTLPKPARTGYAFCGWCSDAACKTPITFPYTVTGNSTLHARWVATDFITDIVINGGTLKPSFDPGVKKYTVALGEKTAAFSVDVVKANPKNKVYMDGRLVERGRQYSMGNGTKRTVSIKVVTPAHKTRYYSVTFTRSKSTNAGLASLDASFNNYTIQPAFDKNVTNYTLVLPTSRTHVVVKAKTESSYAVVSINGRMAKTKNIQLKKGINTVTIIVKAQAGNMKKYTITIFRGTIR